MVECVSEEKQTGKAKKNKTKQEHKKAKKTKEYFRKID